MTILFGKLSPPACASLSRLLLSFAIFLILMAGPVHAADSATQVWRGQYESTALRKMVNVKLTFDASPPELRFETLGCSVGLKLVSKDSTDVYSVVPYKQDEMSGPYCGNWVGGTLSIQPSVDGQQLNAKLVNKKSQVSLTLIPAP